MYCSNCGNQLDDNAAFCSSCGVAVEKSNPVVAEEYTTPEPAAIQSIVPSQVKRKSKVKISVIISAIAIVIVVCILLVTLLSGGSYKDVINKYCIAIKTGNANIILNLYQNDFLDYIVDEEYDSKADFVDDIKSNLDNYSYNCGDIYYVNYEITNIDVYTQSEIKSANENLKDQLNINKKIKEIVSVTVELTAKGDEDEYQNEICFDLGKMGRKWYLFSE